MDHLVKCEQCGLEHSVDEMELTFRRPDDVIALSAEERKRLVQENSNLCTIGEGRYFVRAVLPLPVEGRELPYNIGLWVEVDHSAFDKVRELWSDPNQAEEPPFEVHIANDIPTLPPSSGLKATLHLTGPTTRPKVLLAPVLHPLALEQTKGITAHRAHEYTSLFA